MAMYELNIYKGNEVEKTYTSNHCPWALYVEAVDMQEGLDTMSTKEKMKSLENLVLKLFDGITSEEIKRADGRAVMSLFALIVKGDASRSSNAIKNA